MRNKPVDYGPRTSQGVALSYATNPTFPVVCDQCPEACYRKTYEDKHETRWKCPNGHIRVINKR